MASKYKRFASKMREDLLRQLKLVSAIEEKQIQQLLEEAIAQYLERYKVTEEKSEDGEVHLRFSTVAIKPDENEGSG